MASSAARPTGRTGLPRALDLAVFRQMADLSNDAFYLTDGEGRFLYVNDRSLALSGYTREELLRMSVPDINPEFPPDAFRAFVDAMTEDYLPPFDTLSKTKDGRVFPIEICVARFELDGERYMFGVVRDISERRQLEAARKTFARRMLQTLEAERQRVARELHEDVGQTAATVGILLRALEHRPEALPEEAKPTLSAVRATLHQITESVHRIVRDYQPTELLGLGLEESLRTHVCQFAQRHELTLELATTGVAGLLSSDDELHLFRIVQESLTNVARHARARRVTVRMQRTKASLVTTVRDDGVGFTPEAPPASGFGLVTMRERAELMGATLALRSTARGTEVRLVVPIERGAKPNDPGGTPGTGDRPDPAAPGPAPAPPGERTR